MKRAWLLAPAVAVAQPASLPVSLTWNAPADCPSREQLLAEVARVLGGSHQPRIPATARVDVARGDRGRWQAALSVDARDAHSERNLEAESCEAIVSAAALIVAVAVEGGVPPPVPPVSPPKAPSAPPTESGEAHATQLLFTAAGVIDDGTLPPIAGGGEVALGWSYATSTWRVRALAGASYFPSGTSSPSPLGEFGTFTLLAASARLCASIARGPFDIGPCLGGEIDRMSGQGFGPTIHTLDRNRAWGSAVGMALASWSFSRLIAVFARADAIIPLVQPNFGFLPYRTVYQPSLPAGRAALGVELRFF